jgi:hypothetical protein
MNTRTTQLVEEKILLSDGCHDEVSKPYLKVLWYALHVTGLVMAFWIHDTS